MCDCDDNPAKVCGVIRRKARKEHKCSECLRVIRKEIRGLKEAERRLGVACGG